MSDAYIILSVFYKYVSICKCKFLSFLVCLYIWKYTFIIYNNCHICEICDVEWKCLNCLLCRSSFWFLVMSAGPCIKVGCPPLPCNIYNFVLSPVLWITFICLRYYETQFVHNAKIYAYSFSHIVYCGNLFHYYVIFCILCHRD